MMKSRMLFECGLSPPMSTSHPPNVIHVTSVFRPSPFFAVLPLQCTILNANERTKETGEAWKQGYGIGTMKHDSEQHLYYFPASLSCHFAILGNQVDPSYTVDTSCQTEPEDTPEGLDLTR